MADDDRAVREALERALQLNGFDVALAADGNEAISATTDRTPIFSSPSGSVPERETATTSQPSDARASAAARPIMPVPPTRTARGT